jgi:hypothetical protein
MNWDGSEFTFIYLHFGENIESMNVEKSMLSLLKPTL